MKLVAGLIQRAGAPLPYVDSRPIELVEVELAPPGEGEVLVRIEAAGICHSDLSVVNGTRQRPLPIVGGHESAGVVMELGAGVRDLKVGDHVTSVFLPSCGVCEECRAGMQAFCSIGAASNARGEMIRGGSRDTGGVTVNAICPGWVETALIESQIQARAEKFGGNRVQGIADLLSEKQPSKKLSAPSDIGEIALWLCSNSAHNVTGTAIPVDGGWTAQ